MKIKSYFESASTTYKRLRSPLRLLSSPFRTLPDFIIPGVQKSGTTTLFRYLEQHPNIANIPQKEINYFFHWPKLSIYLYKAFFPTIFEKYYKRIKKEPFIAGEGSCIYLSHIALPKKIAHVIPKVKLILLLRNPVDRAYSQYHMKINKNWEHSSFEEAIKKDEENIRSVVAEKDEKDFFYDPRFDPFSYLGKGLYIKFIEHWLKYFPREQFLILKSEDLFERPQTIIDKICKFLDIPLFRLQNFKKYNPGKYKSDMNPDIRNRLIEFYKPYNKELSDFLDMDFNWNNF